MWCMNHEPASWDRWKSRDRVARSLADAESVEAADHGFLRRGGTKRDWIGSLKSIKPQAFTTASDSHGPAGISREEVDVTSPVTGGVSLVDHRCHNGVAPPRGNQSVRHNVMAWQTAPRPGRFRSAQRKS